MSAAGVTLGFNLTFEDSFVPFTDKCRVFSPMNKSEGSSVKRYLM